MDIVDNIVDTAMGVINTDERVACCEGCSFKQREKKVDLQKTIERGSALGPQIADFIASEAVGMLETNFVAIEDIDVFAGPLNTKETV